MVAHVSDFGIARFLFVAVEDNSTNKTNSIVVKGSIGGLSENCNSNGRIGGVEVENALERDNIPNSSKEMEEAPVLVPSGKCNLRKSLAWDSVFFTSEVASKTFKKSSTHALPGIQEDLRKSAESTSALCSDASALESLEIELFRIYEPPLSSIPAVCFILEHVVNQYILKFLMKPVSKPLSSSKSHGLSKQVLENSKKVLVRPRAGATRSGDWNSSLKPPKILPRVNPPSTAAPTKKTLASSECIKIRNNTAKAAGSGSNWKCVALCQKLVFGATPTVTPSSIPSPKSSSSGSSLPSTPSSQNRSGSTKTLRNRADSRNANPSSTTSIMKTPLWISRNKTESRNSNLKAYLMSTSKFYLYNFYGG
ncbi:uncharacterized protein LOC131249595 [Magnolia sinica]|uniref:uncharacterized protein LOC131249595 n=1 Tax=Magnolia sinica TaxID=86752 RepID=UPI00265A8F9D|nr:uncharacterized protein LOC131249595 [Magnolia sinica]